MADFRIACHDIDDIVAGMRNSRSVVLGGREYTFDHQDGQWKAPVSHCDVDGDGIRVSVDGLTIGSVAKCITTTEEVRKMSTIVNTNRLRVIPYKVWFNPPYTTIFVGYEDEYDKVTVKRTDNTETFDEFGEFCRCIANHKSFNRLLPSEISYIDRKGLTTTVAFKNGERSEVTASNPDIYSADCGLAIALCKSVFGVTELMEFFEGAKYRTDFWKIRKEEARKAKKEYNQKRLERERMLKKEQFEESVKRAMWKMRVEEEAKRRLKELKKNKIAK